MMDEQLYEAAAEQAGYAAAGAVSEAEADEAVRQYNEADAVNEMNARLEKLELRLEKMTDVKFDVGQATEQIPTPSGLTPTEEAVEKLAFNIEQEAYSLFAHVDVNVISGMDEIMIRQDIYGGNFARMRNCTEMLQDAALKAPSTDFSNIADLELSGKEVIQRTKDILSDFDKMQHLELHIQHQEKFIIQDITKNGFQPTDKLKRNLLLLSDKQGAPCTLSDVKKMAKSKSLPEDLKKAVNSITAECQAQEMQRPKPAPKVPEPVA